MAKDPVCKMEIEERMTTLTSEHHGTRYYFCSLGARNPSTGIQNNFWQTRMSWTKNGRKCEAQAK